MTEVKAQFFFRGERFCQIKFDGKPGHEGLIAYGENTEAAKARLSEMCDYEFGKGGYTLDISFEIPETKVVHLQQ